MGSKFGADSQFGGSGRAQAPDFRQTGGPPPIGDNSSKFDVDGQKKAPTLNPLKAAKFATPVGMFFGVLTIDNTRKHAGEFEWNQTVDPKDFLVSQRDVKIEKVNRYKDQMLENGGWVGGPVDAVVNSNGNLVTVDHHRVVAARELGISVPTTIHQPDQPLNSQQVERFKIVSQ